MCCIQAYSCKHFEIRLWHENKCNVNFFPLRNNSVTIAFNFLLASISAIISRNTINTFPFFWIIAFMISISCVKRVRIRSYSGPHFLNGGIAEQINSEYSFFSRSCLWIINECLWIFYFLIPTVSFPLIAVQFFIQMDLWQRNKSFQYLFVHVLLSWVLP